MTHVPAYCRVIFVVLLLISCCDSFASRGGWKGRPGLATLTRNAGQGYEVNVEVNKEQADQRLDAFLSTLDKSLSRSYFGGMCDNALVKVNSKVVNKAYKVRAGDLVNCFISPPQSLKVEPECIPLDILHEDSHILAVNKPNGMVVHPAIGSPNGTFANALLFHLQQRAEDWEEVAQSRGKRADSVVYDEENDDLPETPEAARAVPLAQRPGIVHRLDKGTTGVLVAAKNPSALTQLSRLFAQREISKVYLAICVGHPGDTTISSFLSRSPKNRQIMCVVNGPPGKPAITHTKTLAFDGRLSVVLVRIETGRTHQIRVHLQHRRTPILGDDTYGAAAWNKRYLGTHAFERPLLHAYETSFVHPFTDKQLTIRAPIPADMATLIQSISRSNMSPHGPSVGCDILDQATGYLQSSTDVPGARRSPPQEDHSNVDEDDGNQPDEVTGNSMDTIGSFNRPVGTPIRRSRKQAGTSASNHPALYVPSDRLSLNDMDWTKVQLPEDASVFGWSDA